MSADKKEKLVDMMIDESKLESVSGGYMETQEVASKGKNIVCPRCNSDARLLKNITLSDDYLDTVEYHCGCGCKFVYYGGKFLLKEDFISICDEKGFNYRYRDM